MSGLEEDVLALADEWTHASCQTDGAPCSWHRVSAECADELRAVVAAATAETAPIHTRSQTEGGPDYCAECSEAVKEWIQWPCSPGAVVAAERTAVAMHAAAETPPTPEAVGAGHGYGVDSDCLCGRNFGKVRGLREHLTKMRRHHPRCYQNTGVPDDLPADLCDCRVLRMIDGADQ